MPALNRRTLMAAALGMAWPAWARMTPPTELRQVLQGAKLQGEGRLRFLGLAVYEARLWAPEPVPAEQWAGQPLALELLYARALYGRKIAERSIEEMRRQAKIPDAQGQEWQGALARLIPDVEAGDRLTGVQQPGAATQFFYNGALRGEVRDPEFTRLFFGIWLSPQTSEPALRERLLGQAR
ncbi:MAG: chalcone isomerase family protein [Rubrivivax sp.]|nr:chalcone isomerase family protein [Rubrivivax sp.]